MMCSLMMCSSSAGQARRHANGPQPGRSKAGTHADIPNNNINFCISSGTNDGQTGVALVDQACPPNTERCAPILTLSVVQILNLHAIAGQVFSEDLTDGMVVPTLNGASLTVGVTEDFISFTSPSGVVAYVTTPDIVVCKSVIHVIDAVLLP